MDTLLFDPLYPDVLGAVTGGPRLHLETLQIAVGIYPRQAYLNQPVELVIALQNQTDAPVDVKVAVALPTRTPQGKAIAIRCAKKGVDLTLKAGEAGALRIPLVPEPPTPPGKDYPIRVQVRHRAKRGAKLMRPPTLGAPPSVLAVSPFKLQALSDIPYVTTADDGYRETLTTALTIVDRTLPIPKQPLQERFESLWSAEQMGEERERLIASVDAARVAAANFIRHALHAPVLEAVDDRFALRGLPLHPGEAKAIAKMMIYTLDDGLSNDPADRLEDKRWFQTLCQALAHEPSLATLNPGELAVRYLFDSAVYDAVLQGFGLIRPRVQVNLGDRAERIQYADKVLRWLAGQLAPDIVYIYLPLALGGITVNTVVTGEDDDPWALLDELREAARGRARLAAGGVSEVFDLIEKLLQRAEDDLRRARILRE